MLVDQEQAFGEIDFIGPGQLLQMTQNLFPPPQLPRREFGDHHRVRPHHTRSQTSDQRGIGYPQVIDPNGRIDKNPHELPVFDFLRGAADAFLSEPPNAANRIAASR